MTACRWDRDAEAHLTREHLTDCTAIACAGCRPCTHDDEGNPVRHCRVRRRCTSHLGWTEHACPTCLGKIRANLTRITVAMAAMPAELEDVGRTDRTAAAVYVPGATAHPGAWRARMRYNARTGGLVEDHDERDPWQMLGLRERMIREDLGHDHRLVSNTLAGTCGYLAWVLTDLARDEAQIPVLSDLLTETNRLADHLEAVLSDSRTPERGVPCPDCVAELRQKADEAGEDDTLKARGKAAPRLVRHHGHWCTREGCERLHYLDESGDVWRCPVNAEHEWSHADYEARLVERRGTRKASA